MRRIYVEAIEKIVENDRKIDKIIFGGKEYHVRESYAIGIQFIDDEGYLEFLCKIGNKTISVYCDDFEDYNNPKYFTLKE